MTRNLFIFMYNISHIRKITSFFSKKPKTDYVILSDEEQESITAEVLQMKSGNFFFVIKKCFYVSEQFFSQVCRKLGTFIEIIEEIDSLKILSGSIIN